MKINEIQRPWSSNESHRHNHRVKDSFYQSSAWRSTRNAFVKANPYCKECLAEGKRTPTQVVDHVTRIKDGGDPLNWSNLAPLCHAHHNRKDNNAGKRKK